MKRFFASLFAVVLLLAGVSLAAGGGVALSVFGTDGTYQAPTSRLTSNAASVAIIADLASVDVDIPFHTVLGQVTMSARSPDGTEMFVGSAAQGQVDGYLFGQPYDLATRDEAWATVYVPGVETSIVPPSQQTFWNAQDSGTSASITLDSGAQDETLVLMNADGTAGVRADLWLGFAGERIFTYSVAAIVAGFILILLAVGILARGFRRKRATDEPASATAESDDEVTAQAEHPAT